MKLARLYSHGALTREVIMSPDRYDSKPRNHEWPLWAKALKQFAKPEDAGIGDVVARMIGDENSAAFEAWYLATFGKKCGCKGRRKQWNLKYPLNNGHEH